MPACISRISAWRRTASRSTTRRATTRWTCIDRLKREDGWRRSAWDERRLAQWNEEKAHFALSYTRYREDGSVIGKYESLYILTLKDGSWGVQARSSFGP